MSALPKKSVDVKAESQGGQHEFLRERTKRYNNVLKLITFIVFGIPPLIFWVMSQIPR